MTTTTTTHDYIAAADRHAVVSNDLAIYGAYAPHFRYRQERIQQAAVIANLSQRERLPSWIDAFRERIGMALIAWGTRLEGRHRPAAHAPAAAAPAAIMR